MIHYALPKVNQDYYRVCLPEYYDTCTILSCWATTNALIAGAKWEIRENKRNKNISLSESENLIKWDWICMKAVKKEDELEQWAENIIFMKSFKKKKCVE